MKEMMDIIALLIFFVFAYALGNAKVMEYLDKNHREIAEEIRENTRLWWNQVLDVFKAKTKDQKIKELKEQLEELENE